jgi:hypothetical protein
MVMEQTNPKIVLAPDELKTLFEKGKNNDGNGSSLLGEFLKLYEGNKTGNRTRRLGIIDVTDAYRAIIDGNTHTSYETMWAMTGGAADGLQSRFTLVGSNAGVARSQALRKPTDTDASPN